MRSPSVRAIICMAALATLLPACAGTVSPVQDNLTQGNSAGKPAVAASENNSAAAVVPPAEAGTERMLAADDYDRAVEAANGALSAAPDDISLKEKLADAYIARAWFYKSKRLNPYTVADLFKAAEVAPKYYRAHFELGRFHNNQWQFGIGIYDLNIALSLKPDFAPAYSERAYSYYKNQKYDLGLADANKAIGLDPADAQFYCTRSLIYAATGKAVTALEDADRAVLMAPSDAFTYYNRSLVYTMVGKPELAVADLETTLRLSKDDLLSTRANADLQKLRK